MTTRVRHVETLLFYDTILVYEGRTDRDEPVLAMITTAQRDGWDVYAGAIVDGQAMEDVKAGRSDVRETLTARRVGPFMYGFISEDPALFEAGPELDEGELPDPGLFVLSAEGPNAIANDGDNS